MNNIDTLRANLFDAIQKLKNKEIEVETAKAISDLSQVIINSAKVEVDFIRQNGGHDSGFFSGEQAARVTRTATGTKTVDGASTVHRLK